MRRGVWVFLAIAFGLLTATGCWNPFGSDRGGNGGNVEIDRKNPDNLLNFLATAYEDEDIDMYGEALDHYFEFEFTPEVAGDLGLPPDKPWWGKTEDVSSTGNMFENDEVVGIEMNFEQYGIGDRWGDDCRHRFIKDGVGGEPETTYINGLCQEFIPDIKVHQETVDGPVTLWVNTESRLDIMVTPDREEPGLWTILRIVEIEVE